MYRIHICPKLYWKEKYFKESDKIIFIVREKNDVDILEEVNFILKSYEVSHVFIHSYHSTFDEDMNLKNLINEATLLEVISAEEYDAKILNNKVELRKRFCEIVRFPKFVLSNFDTSSIDMDDNLWVYKNCSSTKGLGQELYSPSKVRDLKIEDGFYLEEYISGTEYSVNVCKSINGGYVILPSIEKGMTDRLETHPSIRNRTFSCEERDKILREYTRKLLEEIKPTYIAEFEYIWDKNNNLYLLEVNPRVSGTLLKSMSRVGLSLDELITNKSLDFAEVLHAEY